MLPRTAWVNLTDNCNNRCQWCYGKNTFSGTEMMSYERSVQLLDWLNSNGCKRCVLIGGEPTLHPEIVDITLYGTNLGLNMAIVSNGRRFSNMDFCNKMVGTGLKPGRVTLSMSAYSEESAKSLTGSKGSFAQFEKGFDNLSQIGLDPGINIVISKPLINHMETMCIIRGMSNIESGVSRIPNPEHAAH
jgi:MoaA/NifB/PqqE/SkfB family radical SAM enzyme